MTSSMCQKLHVDPLVPRERRAALSPSRARITGRTWTAAMLPNLSLEPHGLTTGARQLWVPPGLTMAGPADHQLDPQTSACCSEQWRLR